jgi:hypothetical protein
VKRCAPGEQDQALYGQVSIDYDGPRGPPGARHVEVAICIFIRANFCRPRFPDGKFVEASRI